MSENIELPSGWESKFDVRSGKWYVQLIYLLSKVYWTPIENFYHIFINKFDSSLSDKQI